MPHITSFGKSGLKLTSRANATPEFVDKVLAAARKRWPDLRIYDECVGVKRYTAGDRGIIYILIMDRADG